MTTTNDSLQKQDGNLAESPKEQFAIQKIYIKDASFESPNAPKTFTEKWEPDINMQLGSAVNQVTDDIREVVLSVTITAKINKKVAFLVEVHQAGLFFMKGFESHAFQHLVGSYCPNILFPFVREAIADLVNKGGFPQLLLAPINFDAIYTQQLEQQKSHPAQGGNTSDGDGTTTPDSVH